MSDSQTTKIAPRYPDELPNTEMQRYLLSTAIGRDLDGLADMLGHEPRRHGESDHHLRIRLRGS